jgi:hypothetical protein
MEMLSCFCYGGQNNQLWDVMTYIESDTSDASGPAQQACLLENRTAGLFIDFADKSAWTIAHTVGQEPSDADAPALVDAQAQPRPGFYYVFFVQCTEGLEVSFQVSTDQLVTATLLHSSLIMAMAT